MPGSDLFACSQCGTSCPEPKSCPKCGADVLKICGHCGFKNSLKKKYCDHCGTLFSNGDLGAALPPAGRIEKPYGGYENADADLEREIDRPAAPWRKRWRSSLEYLRYFLRSLASLVFLTLVAVGAVIWALSYWQNNRPEAVVPVLARRFLLLVSRGDSADAYNMLTREARLDCSPDDFDAMWQPVPWRVSKVKLAKIAGPVAAVQYNRSALTPGAPAFLGYLYFQEGTDRWLLSYDAKAIQEAEASLRSDDPDMAFLKAQAAVRINPWNPVGRGLLCEASYESGIFDSAKKQCAAALSLSGKYPSTLSGADIARFKSILDSLGRQKVK